MILDIVNAIKEQAEHISGIKNFRYEGQDLINAQNNTSTVQVWVEDDIYTEYLVTKDLVKMTINIDIVDKLHQDDDKLEVHDNTYKIGIVLLKLISKKYYGILSVEDYSLMTLSQFTDDDLYGHRLTVMLLVPSPITECNIDDFLDEMNEYEKVEDIDITINKPEIDISTINITPTKLRRNNG